MEEAQKNKFLCIAKLDASNNSPPVQSVCRLRIHASSETEKGGELREGKHNRSFLNYSAREWIRCVIGKLNLLRVLDVVNSYSMDEIMWLINSRYITCGIPPTCHASSLISLLWNLQTLVFSGPISLPSEFWQMSQLRHLKMPEITLAGPPDDDNVVELRICRHIQYNLTFLLKLESLVLKCRGTLENMAFPDSLKKLTLSRCLIPWEDMSVVGLLPNLEVLKLRMSAAEGQTWKPNAGEFCQLKFLLIEWCQLEIWEADESNFPSLEHLQLVGVTMEDFAQIETLRTIDLRYCSKSLFLSANKMSQDRENSGCEAIQIQSFPKEAELEKLQRMLAMMEAVLKDLAEMQAKGHTITELERQIRWAVYDAEDTIDAFIMHSSNDRRSISYVAQCLRRSKTLSFAKTVKELREEQLWPLYDKAMLSLARLPWRDVSSDDDNRLQKIKREDNVVGFTDQEATLIKYLKEETEELDVISIVGMPGLGKTTLASKIFHHPKTQFEFPKLIWVYVSQEFNVKDVFLAILKKFTHENMSSRSVEKLAQEVRSRLSQGRFLLFMDDVWTVQDWEMIEAALPKSNKSGKVLITSRHERVAVRANPKRDPHKLRFLTFDESWELLQKEVFGRNWRGPECL
ncbi:hypothetical protein C2S51_003375 [Perilla frutescens var. frutescens]|nr:hypothetical protein C2S51_003375 [Perilla frutescens var. frutescens]